ncbi:MAG: hypothetical protein ACYDDU_20655 [Dermatophilaceae bacterium]
MTDGHDHRAVVLDPDPEDTLTSLHSAHPRIAATVEDALDWVEADPPDPRAKRRRFANSVWAITVYAAGQEWLVIWDEPTANRPVIRYIGEANSL